MMGMETYDEALLLSEKDAGEIRTALSSYLKDISKYPLLSDDETTELIVKSQAGDLAAKERLITCNLRLCVDVANSRFKMSKDRHPNYDLVDLISAGAAGLTSAVNSINEFSFEKKVKFSTWVTYKIIGAVSQAIEDSCNMMGIPEHVNAYQTALSRVTKYLKQVLYREPTQKELVAYFNGYISAAKIAEICAIKECNKPVCLDAPALADSETELGEGIADQSESSEITAETTDAKSKVREALSRLDEQERLVILMTFGFGGEQLSLKEIAEKLLEYGYGSKSGRPFSIPTICNIKEKALTKLKHNKSLAGLL